MKLLHLFILIPVFLILQDSSCSSDDDGGSINNNFITFLGTTNEASGGCNVQSQGLEIRCTYSGFYTLSGLSYTIGVTHNGPCTIGTFNLTDNLNSESNAFFILQVAEDGVAIETYYGISGSIELNDYGTGSNMEFSGTVYNTSTLDEFDISGFIECPQ